MKKALSHYYFKFVESINKRLAKGTPIFIFGGFRGGTTLLQGILNVTSNVAICGEQGFFLVKIAEAYYSMFEGIGKDFLRKNEHIYQMHLRRTLKKPKNWQAWVNWYGSNKYKENYRKFIKSFYTPSAFGVKYWGFKEIRYGINDRVLQFLIDIFPNASFIFIVRDPVSQLASQMAMHQKMSPENNVLENDDFLKKSIEKWNRQKRNFYDFTDRYKKNSVIIRYEDVIDKRDSLSELFGFLKLQATSEHYEVLGLKSGRGAADKAVKEKIFTDEHRRAIIKGTEGVASLFNY
ncbi:MAG: sulfotransferase [Candidatus Omnitrophica bacterium]|nr:sulfotransferase [Candidatus Omnitrophota bacterium]